MAFKQKEKSGGIFPNNRKQKDTHPDFKGDCVIEGIEYWISGWKKTTSRGDKYLSIAFTPKDKAKAEVSESVPNNDADDIPFH